jgi:hypothetical protein
VEEGHGSTAKNLAAVATEGGGGCQEGQHDVSETDSLEKT